MLGIVKMFSPFLPHITEEIYQELYGNEKSVHISAWPEPLMKEDVSEGERVKDIIAEIRRWKNENKREIKEIIIDGIEHGVEDIEGTFGVEVKLGIEGKTEEKIIEIKPNFGVIGPKYREKAKEIIKYIKSTNPEELWERIQNGDTVNGVKITEEMVMVKKGKIYHGKEVTLLHAGDATILLL